MTRARRTGGDSRMKDGRDCAVLRPIRKMLAQIAKTIPILGQIDDVVERRILA
jgi:hypothetical protein